MELRVLNEAELKDLYMNEAHRDFPECELKPWDVVEKLYRQGNYEPLAFYENGELLAYALQVVHEGGKSVLLDYLAVKPEYRDRGIGSEVLRLLRQYYRGRAEGIVIESEHPDEAPDKEAALRRLDFYRRAGAVLTDTQVRLFDILFLIFYLPCGETSFIDASAEMEAHYRVTVPPDLYNGVVEIFEKKYSQTN